MLPPLLLPRVTLSIQVTPPCLYNGGDKQISALAVLLNSSPVKAVRGLLVERLAFTAALRDSLNHNFAVALE